VLDGEIVCLDKFRRPQFRDLLLHRGQPCFFAFDLLMCDGKDLRSESLIDRKHELRRLLTGLPASSSRLRYAEHLVQHGTALFQRICQMDLEGIVASTALDLTSPIGSVAPGSRFGIVTILRWKDAKNCLSANVTMSQLQAGTVVNWLVRNWSKKCPTLKISLGIAGSNTQRRGQIRGCLAEQIA
jgi:hypothetical protein